MLRSVISKVARPAVLSRPSAATRAFHSPFAVLSSASAPAKPLSNPSTTAGAGTASQGSIDAFYDPTHDPDVHVTPIGTRTYVVSTPDPADTPYAVPSGAYPNSSPYAHPPGEALSADTARLESQGSSTSPSPAHPHTTSSSPRRIPTNRNGVGASAAVRFRGAPGLMHDMGGSDSGSAIEDEAGTVYPRKEDELPDVNPPPLSKEGEAFGKAGLKNAWKERK